MKDDPLRYFRVEAQELTGQLEAGLLAYEKHPELLPELFRFAHTLKGGARVVRLEATADLAHAMEDVLAHHREAGTQLSKQEVMELLGIVDAVRGELSHAAVNGRKQTLEDAATPAAPLDFATVRIGLSEMDTLAAGAHEAESVFTALRAELRELGALRRGQATGDQADRIAERERRLTTLSDSLELSLRRLSDKASVLRLLDSAMAFPELERAAHDAAALTGKQVSFTARGGNVKLDGHVLSPLRGALLHLVRNAVAHGVESPAERNQRGKPDAGHVEVLVERRGPRIAFIVSDDGGGIDPKAVRRAAAARGIATEEGDPLELIFHPGLSTSSSVSDLSGRGVGLDAVRTAVQGLKGRVEVRSQPGAGTCFELLVPVSLSSMRALAVRLGTRTLLIPFDSVVSTVLLSASNWVTRGDGRSLLHEGAALPLHDLSSWLDPNAKQKEPRLALVLQTSGGLVGLAADALVGARDIFLRPLPGAAGGSTLLLGTAFDDQGDPELVLDPQGLGLAARVAERVAVALGKKPRKILVVDDSLTTRMLEQSILEGAGYDVDLASSAKEGLEKAVHGQYGLIITDVEMPGMNGYEFTAETRRRPELRAIPVIMVSSLATEESRRRGAEAGINAYIVKGEFDQGAFLGAVRQWLG
jgi:two-component system chemotaxis sensor kinase CheA